MLSFDWVPIRYHNEIFDSENPFYAGAYVYGKSKKRAEIVDGRVRNSNCHCKPASQDLLTIVYGKAGGAKSEEFCRKRNGNPYLARRPLFFGERACLTGQ